MYEQTTYDVILKRMLDRVSDRLDKRESSVIWDTHSATAVELQNLYIELDYLIANSYGDTAAREFLILLCRDRGITPEAATHAVLRGKFTPVGSDVIGKRFNIGDVNYVVMEEISPGEYQVKCEKAGIIGNQHFGQMIPLEYIPGLKTAELTEVLIPGEEEEETESLRKRYFSSFAEQSFGGNHADYLEKVKKIDGVGNVKVTRVWNGDIRPADMIPDENVTTWYESVISGLDGEKDKTVKKWLTTVYAASKDKKLTVGGTVLVTITDSDDYGEASQTLINTVQEILDPVQNAGEGNGLAPIGHVVNVESAVPVTVNVTTTITFEGGYSWLNLQGSIMEVINSYLLELRKSWADSSFTVVRVSQIEARILNVTGVADISNTKLNNSTDNLILEKYQIPVMGGVSA